MRILIQLIYSFLVLPIIFILIGLVSIINRKYRKAFLERFSVLSTIEKFLTENQGLNKKILIHCASMGEFEHIKPLIMKLSKKTKVSLIVSFFSPSGYEYVKSFPGVDLIIYTPFDFPGQWRKFYSLLKPKIIIVSKHDAWPNQIWIAKRYKIPIYLVNASLAEKSSRIKGLAKIFFKQVYRTFDEVYAISESDKKRFEKNFPGANVLHVGDTKFDQVLIRKEMSLEKNLIDTNWLKDQLIFLFGSVWPEDIEHIKYPIKNLLGRFKEIKVILVPHQPEDHFIKEMAEFYENEEMILFKDKNFKSTARILIINTIGVLPDLYKHAHIAYVGGSFKQGIHNVMEPAIYGIPVLYGPVYKNSYEAIKLLENKGSQVINNENEASASMTKLVEQKDYREMIGKNAQNFALGNTGATEKILDRWERYLS